MNILGIMNGTSLDGIDYTLCKIQSGKIKYLNKKSYSFPKSILKQLHLAAQDELKVSELSELSFELGELYSKHILKLLDLGWKIDLIGLHGQTVYHHGKKASLQIGEPSFIKLKTNIPVVFNFRAMDIAAGGEGAPLAAIFHDYLYKTYGKSKKVAFHNIGGISNLSYFNLNKRSSFDTGPGNMLMDLTCRLDKKSNLKFDKGGKLASKGSVDFKLLNKMLKHPYLKKLAPKSCGREEFGESFYNKFKAELSKLSLEDRLATLSEFTATTIVNSYTTILNVIPNTIYFCGGGALNTDLLFRIQRMLPESEIKTTNDLGLDVFAIEGMVFAYLAYLRNQNKKLNLKSITGAKKETILGCIV